MKCNIIESYIEKIYGYAVKHTYSSHEADELSQEILFTVVRELPKLRDESKFEPWLWGIAKNKTKNFRRHMGKQRTIYSYDILENTAYEDEYDDKEEIYDYLRERISMLSKIYRDIIILYYYDGLSVKLISDKLSIPEGTVTWRLSEARKKLKKEYTEMNETALRPVKMHINIYGRGNYNGKDIPFPTVYINDALSQNIMYHCYETASGIEEISKLCGVPAYYIEERIENLLKHEAVTEAVKGKYQTNFIIWSDKHGIYCEENAEKVLLPIMNKMISAFKNISEEAANIDFYKADKTETDLFYLYTFMAFSYAEKHYCNLPYSQTPEKYDGYNWCYTGNMETGAHKRISVNIQISCNLGSRGNYSHTVYNSINGIKYRSMMYDNYINACEDILNTASSDDLDSTANAIKDGYIIKKTDGSLFVTSPAFTKDQKAEFDIIADKYLSPLMPEYSEAVGKFISGYKKLFPKHLNGDADRMCRQMFFSLCSVIIAYAQKKEIINMPSPDYCCDVMLQNK